MEQFKAFWHQQWPLLFSVLGVVMLVGAVMNWKWLCHTEGDKLNVLCSRLIASWGPKGYRIILAITGVALVILGIFVWLNM